MKKNVTIKEPRISEKQVSDNFKQIGISINSIKNLSGDETEKKYNFTGSFRTNDKKKPLINF